MYQSESEINEYDDNLKWWEIAFLCLLIPIIVLISLGRKHG